MLVRENFVIATEKQWNIDNFYKHYLVGPYNNDNWHLVTDKDELYEAAKKIRPRYIFFPHWSWIIPKEIYETFDCVVFHMTNLPYGRGAEPLQHLISQGIKDTLITALKVDEGIDTGPVYIKCPLSLDGNAEEIYSRCSNIIFKKMIPYIISVNPSLKPQIGEPTNLRKRTIEDCRIPNIPMKLSKVYDYIRANDADSYPPAFIETDTLRFEFTRASLKHNEIIADVRITKR